jgi:hypothetical protein
MAGESRDRADGRGAVVTLKLADRALPCEDIKIGGYACWWADLRVLRSAGEGRRGRACERMSSMGGLSARMGYG